MSVASAPTPAPCWLDHTGHPLRQGSDRRQTASTLSAPLSEMAPVRAGGSHQLVWNRMQQRHASEGQATLRGQSRRSRRGGDRDGERRLSRLQWHNQSTCGPLSEPTVDHSQASHSGYPGTDDTAQRQRIQRAQAVAGVGSASVNAIRAGSRTAHSAADAARCAVAD